MTTLENQVLENVCKQLNLQYIEDLLDLPPEQIRPSLGRLSKAQLTCVTSKLISSFDIFADGMVRLGNTNREQQRTIDSLNKKIEMLCIENAMLRA